MLQQILEKENMFQSKFLFRGENIENQFPFYGTYGNNVSILNSNVNIH